VFDRAIIATDFSPSAFALAKTLVGLKVLGIKGCLLLHCLTFKEVGSIALSYTTSVMESNLTNQREMIEKQGIKTETRIVPGLPKREICRIADEEKIPLIVVGAESQSLTSEPFMGDLAYSIMHHARKPILIIRLERDTHQGLSTVEAKACCFYDHILYPTDFSDNAARAFELVKQAVVDGAKKITLMHIQDKSRIEPYLTDQLSAFNQKDQSRMADLKMELEALASVEVDIVLTYGRPQVEIVRQVRERRVRLVIMGSQGRGYVKEVFLGSVGQYVARHADSSVLLIPV